MELRFADYQNMFDYIKFTPQQIKEIAEKYNIELLHDKIEKVEYMYIPPVIDSFYQYIFLTNHVPSQSEFWCFYVGMNLGFMQHLKYSPTEIAYIKARLFRSYNSLVRELHFCFTVKEKFPFLKCLYNIKLDLRHDIDLLISYQERLYGIRLFMETVRSKEFRRKKDAKANHFTNVTYLDMPLRINERLEDGKLIFYDEGDIENMIDKLLTGSV